MQDNPDRGYEFIAQAAHDLRNPIAVIVGAADLLERSWSRLSEEVRLEQVEAIAAHARRLRDLTQELLDWASLETGRIQLRPQPVSLPGILDEATSACANGWPVESAWHEVEVVADPQHLRRVLVNLLTNARRYGKPPLRVETKEVGDGVAIRIIDFGTGVTPELRETMFDPFVKGRGEGTGLGLAIVRGLVEMQGGRIEYRDGFPGACFEVWMPAPPGLGSDR